MDLNFSSHMMHGKKYIYVLVDYSIEYLYFLTICKQCIAPQESNIIFGFHGHFRAKFCNIDNPSLHEFGKLLYCFDCAQLVYIVAYYFIVDELKCITANSLEDNLPLNALHQQLEELRCIH